MKAEWTNKDSLTSEETTKAILVIDMPTNCNECAVKCDGYTAKQYAEKGIRKPSWCPLKPMPEKLQFQEPFNDDYTVSWASRLGFVDGWNACIEELEK